MTKADLIDSVASKADLAKQKAEEIVNGLFDGIVAALLIGLATTVERLLHGFFTRAHIGAREPRSHAVESPVEETLEGLPAET